MVNRDLLLKAFVRAAVLQSKVHANGKTPRQILEGIILGKFTAEATEGRTVISSTEAGGTVTFAMPEDFAPNDVMGLAEEAIQWLESQPDPDKPVLASRRIRRLRASFAKAVMS